MNIESTRLRREPRRGYYVDVTLSVTKPLHLQSGSVTTATAA